MIFLLKHWRIFAGAGLLAILLAGGLWYRASLISTGDARGAARVRAEWAAAVEAANARQTEAEARYAATVAERDEARAKALALLTRPMPEPRTLIVRTPTDAPDANCPRRSAEWLREYNSLADAADR